MEPPLIMVIEDDEPMRELLDGLLTDEGYRTFLWPKGRDARLMIRLVQPDLLILDLWLERSSTGTMVLGLLERDPGTRHIPVIICSAHTAMRDDRSQLFLQKGYRVLLKPFNVDDLLAQVAAALEVGRTSEAHAG